MGNEAAKGVGIERQGSRPVITVMGLNDLLSRLRKSSCVWHSQTRDGTGRGEIETGSDYTRTTRHGCFEGAGERDLRSIVFIDNWSKEKE